MYQCEHCRSSFQSYFSLRSHVNGSVFEGVPRCNRFSGARAVITAPLDPDDSNDSVSSGTVPVITSPVDLQHEICRRHQDDSILGDPTPLSDIGIYSSAEYTGSVNYGALVCAFREYCSWVLHSRPAKFWVLFLATRHLFRLDSPSKEVV